VLLRLLLLSAVLLPAGCRRDGGAIRLATTTSVDSSGLLEALLPAFQQETGIGVDVLAVGSGKALQLARRGDADVTLTHDPGLEKSFLADHGARSYRKIMFNDFLIVGPAGDPARIGEATSAVEAMRRIAASGQVFASRGDVSGTDGREKQLWTLAGARPQPDRLLETGQGMAPTLRVASERTAYCLTDRATFSQLGDRLVLDALFSGGPELLNTYAVTVVGQANAERERAAERLAGWLADGAGRDRIASFTVKGARPFSVWPRDAPRDSPDALPQRGS